MTSGNTVTMHRVFRAPPERVYRAFLDPAAVCKWYAPNGYTATVYSMDARVGGSYKMAFTNFTTGQLHSFAGTYLELVPHSRIRCSDRFDDPAIPGEMTVTIEFKKVLCGTDVMITQEHLPVQIPVEFCRAGWQESLELLAKLVEAETP